MGRLKRDTELNLSLNQFGNSHGVTVPKHWRDRLDLDPDDDCADAELDEEARTITYHF